MVDHNIVITQATPSDVEFIVALSYALFQEDAGQRDPTINLEWANQEGEAYFLNFISDDNNICLLASMDEEVVGYLAGRTISPSSYRPIKQAELESMFVKNGYRGQRVGTQLTHKFLAWAKRNKAQHVTVSAYVANHRAVTFYKMLGFQPRHLILQLELEA